MRTLLLLRHAKSDWKRQTSGDFDRPLNRRGRNNAVHVGQWMKQHHLHPDRVICSPALRTRETLQLLRSKLDIPDACIHFDDRAYLADAQTLSTILTRCPHDINTVLLIGHNPGMELLLEYLCGSDIPLSEKGKLMPTATLAQIALRDDWRALCAGAGKLIKITRPGELTRT